MLFNNAQTASNISQLEKLPFNEWQAILNSLRIDQINGNNITPNLAATTVDKLLKTCFCFMVLGTTDKIRRSSLETVFDWNVNQAMTPNNRFIQLKQSTINRLTTEDFYGFYSAGKQKYILQTIDGILNGQLGVQYQHNICHIEHVLPQEYNRWINTYDWNDDNIKNWLNKLGNLVLLPAKINQAISNNPYLEKKSEILKLANIMPFNINAYGLKFSFDTNIMPNNWTPTIVESRHKYIITQIENWLNN